MVDTVYSDSMQPLPREILQDDSQLVKFTANLYHFTSSEVVTVKLASKKTESYTQIRPVNANEDRVRYGPFSGECDTPRFVIFWPYMVVSSFFWKLYPCSLVYMFSGPVSIFRHRSLQVTEAVGTLWEPLSVPDHLASWEVDRSVTLEEHSSGEEDAHSTHRS